MGRDHDAARQLATALEVLVGHELLGGRQILNRRHPAFTGFFQDGAHLQEALLERDWRNLLPHEIVRGSFEDTCQSAVRIFHDLAIGGRGRALIDAGDLEREAIGEMHAAIEPADEHGMFAGDGVDQLAVRRERAGCRRSQRRILSGRVLTPLLVCSPHAARDPAPVRKPLRGRLEALLERGRFVHVEQVHTAQQSTRAFHVNVRVVESWGDESAVEVDLTGVRARERPRLGVGADGEEPLAFDGEGFRPRLALLDRIHPAVDENEIGCVFGKSGVSERRGNHEQQNHRLFHRTEPPRVPKGAHSISPPPHEATVGQPSQRGFGRPRRSPKGEGGLECEGQMQQNRAA